MTNQENSIEKYIVGGISDFFTKMLEFKENIKVQSMYQKNMRYSTHDILEKLYPEFDRIFTEMYSGYTGLYSIPKITEINIAQNIDLTVYIKNMYIYLQESKLLFKSDPWLNSDIDRLCKMLAITLYKLNYTI